MYISADHCTSPSAEARPLAPTAPSRRRSKGRRTSPAWPPTLSPVRRLLNGKGRIGRCHQTLTLAAPLERKSGQQIVELQPCRLAPIKDRLHDLRRQQG